MDLPVWYGWVILAMVVPGLLVLIGVTIAFLFHRAPLEVSGGPRMYHVYGFDPKTNAARELNLQAESPLAARAMAQMQGMIVTDVTPVPQSPATE